VTVEYDPALISGKRVLIVDDIFFNRTMLVDRLEAWGMRTTAVEDGIEALKELKISQDENDVYDLILLDYLMPGMNGRELASVISDSQALKRPPMIMLSSCDQPVSSQNLKHIGIGTYLVKPVREKKLFDALVTTLSNPAMPKDRLPKGSSHTLYAPGMGFESGGRLALTSQDPGVDILVAEDIHINQDVIRLMLSDSIFRPCFAKNGKEAVEMFKSEPDRYALILMDVSMPVMDGYEATQCILGFEKDTNRAHTPIIAVTGHAMSHDQAKCLAVGMDDYLAKPIRHDALLAIMNAWLAKSPKAVRDVA
jgi:CheY-like chemotaxis protein